MITLAHSGKQHSYLTALSLLELNLLDRYYTSSYVGSKFLQNLIIKTGNSYFSKRFITGLNGNKVCSNWRFEVKEVLYRKLYGKTEKSQNAVYHRDEIFDEYMSKQIVKRKSEMFWGFQGSCLETLKAAKKSGKTSIVELATAHVTAAKNILGEEQRLFPEWADSIDNLVFPIEYEKRLREEPHVADYVLAASEFTKQSLIDDGISEDKIKILPLCFCADQIKSGPELKSLKNRKLKVLYCGTVTQRKGIKYLLDAFANIIKDSAELHIIGNIQGNGEAFKKYSDFYNYSSGIPQSELFQKYQDYDILVLPTIFEGFGLVIPEAMAAGLPVITTSHSFGAEIIEHRKNGSIVPIRDVESLANEIMFYAQLSDEEFNLIRHRAIATAKNYDRDNFRNRIKIVIDNLQR